MRNEHTTWLMRCEFARVSTADMRIWISLSEALASDNYIANP